MHDGAADPELYDFRPYRDRPKTHLAGRQDRRGLGLAQSRVLRDRSAGQSAPQGVDEVRPRTCLNYAHRDYANRVGHWRMAEAMSRHDFPGSVSLSVALCQHIPEVVADAAARGWEFFSHGIYNTRYSYGMDEAQERAVIEDSIRTVREATGQTIKGWLAPALTHTTRTLDLIAEYGLTYTCDLYHDDQPGDVKVALRPPDLHALQS